MKAQLDEGGGRTLLGDNKDGGMAMPRLIRFQRVGIWISPELPDIYMYNGSYVHSIPTREKFDLRRAFWNVTTSQLYYKFFNWT
jgi:hypothetical protein